MRRMWTETELNLLRENYPNLPAQEVADLVGWPIASVRAKAKVLKLRKVLKHIKKAITEDQERFIEENYGIMTATEIGKHLDRSRSQIKNYIFRLGLKLPENIRKEHCSRGQIKPGSVPLNKGKRVEEYMSPAAIEKCRITQFKKGNLPHNTKSDGEITVRRDKRGVPYQFIRISIGVWKPLHVHLWEEENGSLPKGFNVIFQDKNTQNTAIENLRMISNEELMALNTIHRYPIELKEVIRLTNKLNRKIQKHGQK